jgi:hypothetical protein
VKRALKQCWLKAWDPERRRKFVESRRGKPRPPHVVDAVRKAHLGVKASEEARRKMRQTRKRLGIRPPVGRVWEKWEDELLATLPAIEVARRTARTMTAIYCRRVVLKIPDGRSKANRV